MTAYWTIYYLVIDRRLTITRASLPDVGDLVVVDRLKHQRHEQHRHGEIGQARDQAIADDIGIAESTIRRCDIDAVVRILTVPLFS